MLQFRAETASGGKLYGGRSVSEIKMAMSSNKKVHTSPIKNPLIACGIGSPAVKMALHQLRTLPMMSGVPQKSDCDYFS